MLLYDVFLAIAALIFVVVAGLVGWSIVRHRDSGNVRLDLLWWALPTALVIVLFLLTARVLGATDERTDDPERAIAVGDLQVPWRAGR